MCDPVDSAAGAGATLQPGQIIRPALSLDKARGLVEEIWGLTVTSIKEELSYDDKNYFVTVAEEYENKHIKAIWPHGYIFKVLNALDSPKKHVDAEHAMQAILSGHGLRCPRATPTKGGADKVLQRIYAEGEGGDQEERRYSEHICRLMTFVPGQMFHSVPYRPGLLYRTGRYLARVHDALQGFRHPALDSHETVWALTSLPRLDDFLYAVRGDDRRQLIRDVIDTFSSDVVPLFPQCTQATIHGDANEQNLVVSELEGAEPGAEHDVYGIIDFGDAQWSYTVCDLAITMMYMCVESRIVEPLDAAAHTLAGYLSLRTLNGAEWAALRTLVAARYAQSLTMGEYTYAQDPGNDYVLVTARRGWPQLRALWDTPQDELYARWRNVIAAYSQE